MILPRRSLNSLKNFRKKCPVLTKWAKIAQIAIGVMMYGIQRIVTYQGLFLNVKIKDSFDIVYSFNLQNSFDCLFCHDSFGLNFSENSRDSIDSYFLFDCRNCQNCFMSWNLRNKQYCIRNKQYTKEEYEKELKKINLGSYKNLEILKNELEEILKDSAVHRENFNLKTTSSIGNYLTNCDKCLNTFAWENSQNCHNCIRGLNSKDSIDLT